MSLAIRVHDVAQSCSSIYYPRESCPADRLIGGAVHF